MAKTPSFGFRRGSWRYPGWRRWASSARRVIRRTGGRFDAVSQTTPGPGTVTAVTRVRTVTIAFASVLLGCSASAIGAVPTAQPRRLVVVPGKTALFPVQFDDSSVLQSGTAALCFATLVGPNAAQLQIAGPRGDGVVDGGTLAVATSRLTTPGVYGVQLTCAGSSGAVGLTIRVLHLLPARHGRPASRGAVRQPTLSFASEVRPFTRQEVQAQAALSWAQDGAAILAGFRGTGQCTDWAAQKRPDVIERVTEANYVDEHFGTPAVELGNALTWANAAAAAGMTVSSTPVAGALVVWQPGVEGANAGTGHVGYVESVSPDGSTFSTSEMNVGAPFQMGHRTLSSVPVQGRQFIWP